MGGPQGGGGMGEPAQPDPLTALQEVIQMLPAVMSALPDPRDTQDVVRALLLLTGVQTRLMGNGPQGQSQQ